MGTIPSYDPATTPLSDTDQIYLEQGVGIDRGKRATVQMLRDAVAPQPRDISQSSSYAVGYLSPSGESPINAIATGPNPTWIRVFPVPGGTAWDVDIQLSLDAATRAASIGAELKLSRVWTGATPSWADAFFTALESRGALSPLLTNALFRASSLSADQIELATMVAYTAAPDDWFIKTTKTWATLLGTGAASVSISARIFTV